MKTLGDIDLNSDSGASGQSVAQTAYEPGESLPPQFLSRCRRVALLSVCPGVGQIRNGEIAKGMLFLAVTISNLCLLLVIFCGDIFRQPLTGISAAFHHQPNWLLITPLQTNLRQGPVLFIYATVVVAFIAYAVRDAYDQALSVVKSGRRLPRARLELPEATSGSYLVHFAFIAAFALALVLFVAPQMPHDQVTDIELVKEPQKAHKSNPAPKRVAPKKPEVKPVVKPKPVVRPPTPVKVEKPKPTPVAVAVPTTAPTPITAAPVMAPSAPPQSAPVPTAEGSGDGSPGSGEGEAEVDMGPYMRALQQRIKLHWFPPKGNENKRIKVSFTVYKDGHIAHLKLSSSSGVSMADDAAMQAVQEAAPFAHLPEGVGNDIDINFTFDYHVFGGG
jgi:TonB family protein